MEKYGKAFKVGSLFDGESLSLQNKVIVTVNGTEFGSVLPWSAENRLISEGYEIEDCSSLFMMPGLIDSHVHSTLPGDGTSAEDFFEQHNASEVYNQISENLKTAIKSGITTIRDCGSHPDYIFKFKKDSSIDKSVLPDLLICGSSITSVKGHTHFFGGECKDEREVIDKVTAMKNLGADFIKLIATGGGTKGVVQYAQMLTDSQLKTACDTAHSLGLYTTAHVCTTKTAKSVFNAGIDMIEHLLMADESNNLEYDSKLIDQIAEKNIPVCITMSAINISISKYEKLNRKLTKPEQEEHDMLARFRNTIYKGFEKSCRQIRYIPGTDAGWRFSSFDSMYYCLEAMTSNGYSNAQALASATSSAADILGISDKVGRIKKNLNADFILLNGNPVEKLDNLLNVSAVYKKGKRI